MNDTFFAAIAGALVGFLGVLITLRANQHNFETALREEREKVREEREFKTKHEALLSAIESVTRCINYYITLSDRELPKDGTSQAELSEMGVALNRLHFFCGIDTIKQSIALGQVFNTAYTRALKAKMPAMFITEEIKVTEITIANLEKMNDQIQQEIIALLSKDYSSPLIVIHREQLMTNNKTISELHEKNTELIKNKYQLTEDCRDVVLNNLKEIHEALRNLLLMARKELAFSIDEDAYNAMLTPATESAIANTKNLLEEIRTEIKKKMQ